MSRPYHPPLYARLLRLRTLHPSAMVCFALLEGAVALGVVLALAEVVSWWAVPLLPLAVAVMVKFNDMVAGALPAGRAVRRTAARARPVTVRARPVVGAAATHAMTATTYAMRSSPTATGRAPVRAPYVSRGLSAALDPVNSPRQRFRQSAQRRYR